MTFWFILRAVTTMKLNYILGLGIVLSLVGISLLFSFGFLYLKPYMNVMNFKETLCKTVSMSMSKIETLVKCRCATDGRSECFSDYPCTLARVNFTSTAENVGDLVTNVILYDSFETYYLFQTNIPQNETQLQVQVKL